MNWRRSPHRFPIAAVIIAIAMAAVLSAVAWQIAVNRNPDPCDRSYAMRQALEWATRRDCDLITDADLADVRWLSLRGPLQRSDFTGLDNLRGMDWYGPVELLGTVPDEGRRSIYHLGMRGQRITKLPPGIFAGFTNLRMLDLGVLSDDNPYYDDLTNHLTELPPGVFDDLANLQRLDLSGNPGVPFTITHPNADLDCVGCQVVPP